MTTEVEPIKAVADILQTELELAKGSVMVINQKWIIPNTKGIFIALSYLGPGKVLGNVNTLEDIAGGAGSNEVQETSMLHTIQIDVMSYGDDARTRKEEIAMALNSQHSLRKQSEYNMRIGQIPTAFMDASSLEATGRLNRFITTITIGALHRKVKVAEYYDKFTDPEVITQ